ncbi:MAG: T9SS type A sorting domain-containing protein, partial [bacterium]
LSLLCQRYSYHTGLPPFQICRELYEVHGSSADYGYGAEGAMLVCPELCSPHVPDTSRIELLCQQNLNANLELLQRCSHGIRGRIYDSITNQPIKAMVEMQPPYFPIYTDSLGYYFRYAHQGTYSIKVIANGFREKVVSNIEVLPDTYTIVDIALVSDTAIPTFAYKCVSSNIEDPSNHSNTSLTIFSLGTTDNRRLSLGVRGWAAFDMQYPIINGPGYDFIVYEDDSDLEACSVFVSNDWNGPWQFCGFDTGTSSFDLSRAGLGMARYVRIVDDGDGVNGPTGGFDLDAIEAMVVNAPALGLENRIVYDSSGNNNGRFDPGETIELVLELRNYGRLPALSVIGTLTEDDPYVEISDSVGIFDDILPDSTRNNNSDRFVLLAHANTPTEHIAQFMLHLNGTGYQDSISFTIRIGEFIITDPIPDGPREPALYWAYDNVDTFYFYHPTYEWVEIKTLGTRLSYANNDEVKLVNLPVSFGPWRYYGNHYTQVSISADGWIAAGSNTTPSYRNTPIPDMDGPEGFVALNYDDLYPNNSGSGGIYYYHDETNHRFIIEYDSVPYYNPRTVMDKFELIIYDTTITSTTGDNILIAQYQTANRLSSSTVGIEDPTGSIGIQCLYEATLHRGCAPWTTDKAIKYTTDAPSVGLAELVGDFTINTLKIAPNPFRTSTVIRIPNSAFLNHKSALNIYDITGKLVRTFLLSTVSAKRSTVSSIIWDGKDFKGKKVSAGVYFIKLDTASQGMLKKVVLTR